MSTKRIFAVLLTVALLTAALMPLTAFAAEAAPLKPVQVFDIAAGKVVKTLPNDAEFQKFAGKWLKSVTGLSPQLKPDDKCGFVYRIPLGKPELVKTGQLQLEIQDVFLFYCPDKEPLLLVFDTARKPYLLLFKANLKPFLKKVSALSR